MAKPEERGYLTSEEVKPLLPPKERMEKGPFVVVECIQRIPCNPCVEACPFGAITKKSLADPPRVDYDKCTGCGSCIAICPGLAIFVVNLVYSSDKAVVLLPHEMLPVPERGQKVKALNRKGEVVGEAEVVSVRKEHDTYVVGILVDKELAMEVRAIKA